MIIEVFTLRDFPRHCLIAQFLGKNFDEAIGEAEAWAKVTGYPCPLYFKQGLITKTVSILVSYSRPDVEGV